jgi:hypothetical protein
MGCGFWSEVLEQYHPNVASHLDELQSVQGKVETRNAFPWLVLGAISGKVRKRYQRLSERLYITISRTSKAGIVVDSSKSGGRSTGRALALSKYTDLDVRAVFLVRDGRGVMWSALKGPGSPERGLSRMPKPVRALRALVSWCVTNLACMASSRLMPSSSVVLVRYEDLVTETEVQLERIARVVPFDPAPLQNKLRESNSFVVGHNIAGNRLRFAEKIRLNPDFEWQDRLPGVYKALFWLIAGPLAWALGYRPGRAYSQRKNASLPAG